MNIYRSTKNNIFYYYIYVFLSGLYFDRALWVLYLVERGMNMSQVGVLEALLHLAIFFFEVPTGIIADLYGRKTSLIIGQFLSLFYALFMFISGNFFVFTLAFAMFGLASTFKSGAEQAIIYDSLVSLKQENKYTKILGNRTAIVLISLSLAKLIGGYLAEIDWNIVYLSIFFSQLIGLFPLLMLSEPIKVNEDKKKKELKIKNFFSFKPFKDQFIKSISLWKSNPEVRIPILLYIMVLTVIVVVIFYSQEYFARFGLSTGEIGIIFTVESLLGVVAAKMAYRFENRWSSEKIIRYSYYLFIIILIIFGYFQSFITIIALFILGMISEFIDPIFSNLIQLKIDSSVRATVFSLVSLFNSMAIMIFFPLFGLLIDKIGFNNSFMLLLFPMVIVLLFRKKLN